LSRKRQAHNVKYSRAKEARQELRSAVFHPDYKLTPTMAASIIELGE